MLDIDTIRSNPQRVKEAIRAKGTGSPDMVDELLEVDEQRRSSITEMQETQARQNDISEEIGTLKREGKEKEAQERIEETSRLKENIEELKEEVENAEESQRNLLLKIPNVPHPSVPVGDSEEDNEVEETIG